MANKDREKYNEYMSEYMLRRYHERMGRAREMLGGKCAQCGIDEDLHLDHIDYRTKSFTIAKLWSVSEERFLAELKKCQLLCRPHHEEKSVEEIREMSFIREAKKRETTRGFRHGTVWSYRKHKCRCEDCIQAAIEDGRHGRAKPKALHGAPIEHGTRKGYLLEVRRKLPTCAACRKANAEYTRSLTARKDK